MARGKVVKREIDGNRPQKTKYCYRWLAMLLCIVMVFFACGSAVKVFVEALGTLTENLRREELKSETSGEIRARLLRQIRAGWDPYSEDMSLEEFYVLMEMFGDGTLPLKNVATFAGANANAQGMAVSGGSEAIPRTMFLFAGLSGVIFEKNQPLAYFNELEDETTREEAEDFPAGLDLYGAGYMRPPMEWTGVQTEGMQVVIVSKGVNDGNSAIAGDVIQDRFLSYDGYYVKQVTVEGIDATILGVVERPNHSGYVYYYLSAEGQDSTVSTTTMSIGNKFIIQYVPNEHEIDYKVYLNEETAAGGEINWDALESFAGLKDITDDPVGLVGYDDTWVNSIFGASRPLRTTDGAYSFDVSTPFEYEVRLYRQKGNDIGQYTGKGANLMDGYSINDGYPLGAEPVYESAENKLLPNTAKGPSAMTTRATLYNNLVMEDRVVIAVVTRKAVPKFDAYRLLPSTNNTSGRGCSAYVRIKAKIKGTNEEVEIPYDYEDLYLWANGGNSKYDYYADSRSLGPTSSLGHVKDGNIATADGYRWNNKYDGVSDADMYYNAADGTYSYQWTWQTNNDDAFVLDTLEINGVAIPIPYLPKQSIHAGTIEASTVNGVKGYTAEAKLPDGAVVKVEQLMAFATRPQRVYRFTITGARSNVTLTNMNLFQSASGAPEVSVYSIEGVYADYTDRVDPAQSPSMQYYDKFGNWTRSVLADVLVDTTEGINYNGDAESHYASIRFKLADGYGSPYYICESPYTGIVDGQATAVRSADGTVTPNVDRIRKMSDLADGEAMDPQYIYQGGDGWYYIRLTGHPNDKFVLLTIGAIQTRYVVHYIPGTDEVPHPNDMPQFEHTIGICPSFLTENTTLPMKEYDDNAGSFYDTFKNNIISIPSDAYGVLQPTDPEGMYLFVDWVLVDDKEEPIEVDGKQFHFFSQAIDLTTIDQYTVYNDELGDNTVDVYVIRLKPTWRKIVNPFKYNVVLNWVDAQGNLHKEDFSEYWDAVLTEGPAIGESIYVYVNKLAGPFWDWIAQHPTYNFWDAVNNATDDENGLLKSEDYIMAALDTYLLNAGVSAEEFERLFNVLAGLSGGEGQAQDFIRLGSNTFAVSKSGNNISLWMYEDKGGLVFHKDVQEEAFTYDEEFYFTVKDVTTGSQGLLDGVYKAYPESIPVEKATDADAWNVTFENGNITHIVKNGRDYGTCFPLRGGEGIRLYIPEGRYTIVELGSKSGGTYRAEVEYNGTSPGSTWDLPTERQWLSGSSKTVNSDGKNQVSATVDFKVGNHNVVQTIIFHNQTSALSVEKDLDCNEDEEIPAALYGENFTFYVTLKLPDGYSPLGTDGNRYFNLVVYDGSGKSVPGSPSKIQMTQDSDGNWNGTVTLKPGQRAVIVMTVPDQEDNIINYWVTEDTDGWDDDELLKELTPLYYDCEGSAVPAKCAHAEVVNWYKDPPGNGYLVITETRGDSNDTFLYRITNKRGKSLTVSVRGGGKTYVFLPHGTYTVEELSEWSWRYEDGVCEQSKAEPKDQTAVVKVTVKNDEPEDALPVDYTNDRDEKWLGGETAKDNRFDPLPTEGGETDPDEPEIPDPEDEVLAMVKEEKKQYALVNKAKGV